MKKARSDERSAAAIVVGCERLGVGGAEPLDQLLLRRTGGAHGAQRLGQLREQARAVGGLPGRERLVDHGLLLGRHEAAVLGLRRVDALDRKSVV